MEKELPSAALDAWRRALLASDAWLAAGDERPSIERRLGGGLSNAAFVVSNSRNRWVLRVPTAAPGPGVSRHREYTLQRLAASAGLAPEPLYFEPETGVMLMPFLPGPCSTRQQDRALDDSAADGRALDSAVGQGLSPAIETVVEVANLARRIHGLPGPGQNEYQGTLGEGDGKANWTAHSDEVLDSAIRLQDWQMRLGKEDPIARLSKREIEVIEDAAARIAAEPATPAVCHNDLLTANRLRDSDGTLVAIDWEYACPGDPYFDLAAIASELREAERLPLLTAYLGHRPSPANARRLEDQYLLYLGIALCWHCAAQSEYRLKNDAHRALLAACRVVSQ